MPNPLKKRCALRGCPNTTRHRFCEDHAPQARQFYDRRRGSTTERGYDGPWKRLAERRRQLDCSLCQSCLKEGLLRTSPLVDHIIPIHIRPDWRQHGEDRRYKRLRRGKRLDESSAAKI